MKNILIVASGRPHGNTMQLAEAFASGAREAGHAAEIVSLSTTRVEGCLGYNACKRGAPCVQRDDFAVLMPKIERADMLVLASPLYYWTFSARTKAFIERFYSIAAPDTAPPRGRYEKYPEKDCALLMTAADDLFWTFSQAASYYDFAVVQYLGFRDRGKLLAGGCGGSYGAPKIHETGHLESAYAFGKHIYEEKELKHETQG